MQKKQIQSIITLAIATSFPFASMQSFAAKAVNLAHQPTEITQSLLASGKLSASKNNAVQFKELRRHVDFNRITHIRFQQTFEGHPVIGADAIAHVANVVKDTSLSRVLQSRSKLKLNGIVYQDIKKDLAVISKHSLTDAQATKAVQHAISDFQQSMATVKIAKHDVSKAVFINNKNKARWVYVVSFYAPETQANQMPSDMRYILDAASMEVYAKWNEVKNITNHDVLEPTFAGGYGGNVKMGKLIYDGLKEDLSKLEVMRNPETATCYLQNDKVTVKKYGSSFPDDDLLEQPFGFACDAVSEEHNNVYWSADLGAVNDGYSPGNDALFNGGVVKGLYRDWYDADVLVDRHGKPIKLNMVVHKPNYDNAYWNASTATMTFGDGYRMFYPLTSLGVTAHEVSHGYTSQNSNLAYYGQSGGMNEAFSDMAAQAAEFYAYGKNSWEIGPEIFKKEGRALRYMEQPSKDCNGGEPGNWCSIDHFDQYYSGLNVHYSSGIYNRAFFLLGTAEGWDVQKAFNVMVKANKDYWTSSSSFAQGACGVLLAANDYGYDAAAVYDAFETVGVDTSEC